MHDQIVGRAKADNVLDRLCALICVFDANAALIDCNSTAEAMLGLPRDGLRGRALADLPLWHRDEVRARIAAMVETARGGQTCRADLAARRADGQVALLDFQLSALDRAGEPLQLIAFGVDVTARQDAEKQLRAREALLRGISETTSNLVYAKDEQSRFLYVNPRIPEVVGLPASAILGRRDPEFMPHRQDGDAILANDREVMTRGVAQTFEERFTGSDGAISYWTSTKGPMRDDAGRVIGIVGVSTDVTALKAAQAELQREVHARELLLYEVNHRVKNSLQLVTSILAIEASKIEDAKARGVLMDARRKIGHIAQLHQQLYAGGQHDRVDFAAFLRDLAGGLIAAAPARSVALEVSGPSAQLLHIRLATPLAMLASELITNALKHAFPDRAGRIALALRIDGCVARLVVEDDGIGLPPGFDPAASSSVGMQIITGLVAQLRGQLATGAGEAGGTRFEVTVPVVGGDE